MAQNSEPRPFRIPLLSDLIPNGIDYSTFLLVEFESQSCWYDMVYTMASQALANGVKTDLHVLQHSPREVREGLRKLGVDVARFEQEDLLRIIDSYTVQIGIGEAEKVKGSNAFKTESVKISEWALAMGEELRAAMPESEKFRLHIDDNSTVLTRYNREDEIFDYWRTRTIPVYKSSGAVLVNAYVSGVASEVFTRQLEALADGIIDCKSQEEEGNIEHYIRVRMLRGKSPDMRWQRVLLDKGEVVFDPGRHKLSELRNRFLATVLFLDIVDSTKHLAKIGDKGWRELLNQHNEVVRKEILAFQGREVNTTGDGFVAMFDAPTRGIECAKHIRDSVGRFGIEVRAGLHTGEVEVMGDNIGGIAVNVAARVASAAGPSEILVSSTLKDSAAGSGFQFRDRGFRMLKGLPEKTHMFLAV